MQARHRAIQFLGWTFGLNALLGLGYFLLYRYTELLLNQVLTLGLLLLYMWVPALVAWFLIKRVYGETLREHGLHFRPNRAWLGAWLYPLLTAGLTVVVALVLGFGVLDTDFSVYLSELQGRLSAEEYEQARALNTGTQLALMLLQALVAGTTINALAAFGEELGWRGLLYTSLRPLGFWRANLLIGLIWGVWHTPIILTGYNFPEHPYLGVLVMTLGTLVAAPLIGYVRERSGSVIAASIYHGVFNALAGLPILLVSGAPNILRSELGVAGIIAMGLLILLSVAFLGMGRRPRPTITYQALE